MSKNISIKEGNVGKNFGGVKKIAIKDVGGNSTSYWVPEDETRLTTKHINENGTYKASEEKDSQGQNAGYYGYSQVTVSGIGTGTYVAQEGDRLGGEDLEKGNPYGIDKDGAILLPSAIGVIAFPSKTVYRDGEKIDTGGLVVAGFVKDAQGELVQWEGDASHPNGVIPTSELTIVPDTAHFTGDEGTYEKNGVQALGILCDKYSAGAYINGYHNDAPIGITGGGSYFFLSRSEEGYIYYTRYNGNVYGISGNASAHGYFSADPQGNTGFGSNPAHTVSGNVFQYWNTTSEDNAIFNQIKNKIPVSEVNPNGVDFSNPTKTYTMQEISVVWNRIKDGEELTTSFKIGVIPSEE